MIETGGGEDVGGPHPVVGMLLWPDRFEDFHNKVGISFEDFRARLSGTWLVGYLEALRFAGIPGCPFVDTHGTCLVASLVASGSAGGPGIWCASRGVSQGTTYAH
jgi:hypothetical protein